MKEVAVEMVKESQDEGMGYSLLKLSVKRRSTFCICIDGEELSCEGVGNSLSRALEIFDTVHSNRVSPEHLSEILYDLRMEIYC